MIDRMTGGWIDGQIWKQNMKTNIFLAMQIVLKQEKDINAVLNKYCFLYMRWKLLLIILQQEDKWMDKWWIWKSYEMPAPPNKH